MSRSEPTARVPGTVTLAIFPDTQYYTVSRSSHLARQADWVVDHRAERDIRAVIHLGDITEHNSPKQWEFARARLDRVARYLPLALATGNHDYGDGGSANRRVTLFIRYFGRPGPATRRALVETLAPGDLTNAYYAIPLAGVQIGLLVLEWCPRRKTVGWAHRVLARHSRDRVIVVTHAYLYDDDTRYDARRFGGAQRWNPRTYPLARAALESGQAHPDGAYDGEMLWQGLVRLYPNVFMTLNGHVNGDGTGYRISVGRDGNTVHQVLVNYQMLAEGGLGYLRLLEFDPDGETLRMKTYSPSLDRWALARDQTFDVVIAPPLWVR